LRLNNVGIGKYKFFGFRSTSPAAQARITGEIHILKGLHNELKADRETFREYADNFSQFNKSLSKKLGELIPIARDLKPPSKKLQEEERKKKISQKRKEIISEEKERKEKEQRKRKEEEHKEDEQRKRKEEEHKEDEQRKRKEEEHKEDEQRKRKEDPVVDFKETSGQIVINEKHELFKVYYTKYEKIAIKNLLFTMKVIGVPEDIYFKIIEYMISLRKEV